MWDPSFELPPRSAQPPPWLPLPGKVAPQVLSRQNPFALLPGQRSIFRSSPEWHYPFCSHNFALPVFKAWPQALANPPRVTNPCSRRGKWIGANPWPSSSAMKALASPKKSSAAPTLASASPCLLLSNRSTPPPQQQSSSTKPLANAAHSLTPAP